MAPYLLDSRVAIDESEPVLTAAPLWGSSRLSSLGNCEVLPSSPLSPETDDDLQ